MHAPHSGWFIARCATRAGQAHKPPTTKKEPSSTRAWLLNIIFHPLIISAAHLECD